MKSIKRILSIWSIMFVFALYISSCCTTHLTIIGEGTIRSTALDREVDIFSDSITGPFRINILTEVEVTFNDISELGFTQGLAVACNEEVVNEIDLESIEILLDKSFQYDNSDFKSETDLVLIEEIKNKIKVFEHELRIDFDEAFFSKATFEKGIYNFQFNYKTSDGFSFSNEINLNMNI